MADSYATRSDVYKYGLPRGALGNQSRIVEGVSTSGETFELEAHGFETGDVVQFRPVEGNSLPSPLAEGTQYYVKRVDDALFQVSTTDGGSAVNLTTTGGEFLVTMDLPFDALLEFYSRWVDDHIPHLVPLESPYPVIIVGIVAQLTAKRIQELSGVVSVTMKDAELAAKAQLERWAKGQPVRDAKTTASANLAISKPITSGGRGWGSGGLP